MGMFKMSTGGAAPALNTGGPQPWEFRLLEEVMCGDYLVARLCYPNCTTFDGNKILVLRGIETLREAYYLDPHFFEGHSVIARFQPTYEGMLDACRFARSKTALNKTLS